MLLGIAFLLFDALRHRRNQKAGRIRTVSDSELLRVQAPHLLGHREVKFAVRIVLWLGAIALTIFGLLLMAGVLDSSGSDAAGRRLSQAHGMSIALFGGDAGLSRFLTRFLRGFL